MVLRHPRTGTRISLLHLAADNQVHLFAHAGPDGLAAKSPCGMSRIHTRQPENGKDRVCDACQHSSQQWALAGKLEVVS